MADYRLTENDQAVIRTADNATIPNNPDNRDWQEYQQWLIDGGAPDPYVPPTPEIPQTASTLGIKLALEEIGKWEAAQQAMADGKYTDDWTLASIVTHEDIAAMDLGLSEQEINQLFFRADDLAATPLVTGGGYGSITGLRPALVRNRSAKP